MKNNMPRTPFSTQLSGSAKETELRLRNIFSGPKKRPPVLFLALMFSVCVFCGNLVSCHVAEPVEPEDTPSSARPVSDDGLADEEARWMLYWEDATQKLFEQREDYSPDLGGGEPLLNVKGESVNLLMCAWSPGAHAGGFYNLLLGTFDQEGEPVDFYDVGGDAGLYSTWEEADGLHILCANTVTYQGWESGGAPMHFRFDGDALSVVDEVPPSVLSAPAMPSRLSEWDAEEYDYKYLPLPGAVEVYQRTEGWDNMFHSGLPQWEYAGIVPLTTANVDPIPLAVRDAARTYLNNTTLPGDWASPQPTTGTPILRLEQTAVWTDFSQLSLCSEWKNKKDLTLVAWDLEFGDPGADRYYIGSTHLLFLKEGEELIFLISFYDHELTTPPEPDLLAGLSPYNWNATEALYDAGYLTARPKLADVFTKVPVPQQVWTLAREYLDQSDLDLQLDAMETRFFCVEEPYWMGVCSMETSQNGVKQPTQLAFFHTSSFRSFSMLVYALPEAEVADIEKQTRAAAHGLLDYDVALWDRSTPVFPTAYGPGNYDGVFTVQGSEEDEDSLGMTWTEWGDRYTAQYRYEGWNTRFCTSLDTTRKLPTTRGVKVGDSKSAVCAAYPELKSGPYPGLEGDFLWYEGYRTQMVFFFENDKLSRLLLMETD